MKGSPVVVNSECQCITGHQSAEGNMKYDYVHRYLSTAFQGLGRFISKHPLWFVIVPLIITGFLSIGFIRVSLETRLEYLYAPSNGRSSFERTSIEKLFPRADSQETGRVTRLPPFASVIATAEDDGDMLTEGILNEIAVLDSVIRNITVKKDNQIYFYHDICLKSYNEQCFTNDGLKIRGKMDDLRRGKFKIKYPVDKDWLTMSVTSYPYNLGGVTVNEEGDVTKIKAFRLFYFLYDFTEKQQHISNQWMEVFLEKVPQLSSQKLKVSWLTRKCLDIETNKITYSILPSLVLAVIVMAAFGIVSCMTSDWVSSKPWLGIAGCVSSLLGTAAAYGILLMFGAEYVDINIAIVFLMLGIGMDDSFVILAAWRLTNPKDNVETRMSQAYSESAVSVSITSLTNFLASCIGLVTPYQVVRTYSLYSAMSIIFAYIAQITFFGGCMALSGRRELKNRHAAAFCFPVERNSSKGCLHTILVEGCTGEKNINLYGNTARETISIQAFILLGKLLSKMYIKISILVAFLIYFALGVYFIKNYMVTAFDYTKAFPSYSYANDFVKLQYKYFSEYSFSFQVVINATLDYSDPKVQEDVEEIIHKIESSRFVHGSSSTESWLREYITFHNSDAKSWFFEKLDMNNSEEFIDGLQNVFLKMIRRFKDDVRFSEDGSKIVASRYVLASVNITNAIEEKNFVNEIWKIADDSKYPVYIINPYFFIYDLSSSVEMTTKQCVIASAVLIVLVFVLFIPNFICALTVSLAVVFIETGLLGYMSLWNVNLNIISMICLVVSVGLSVDYSAHISYSFISCKAKDSNERLRIALLSVGYPAFQGCISTILGVIVLCAAPIQSVIIFFKIIFLVMTFSFFHAILLTPVVLSLLNDLWTFVWENVCHKMDKTTKFKNVGNGVDEVTQVML